ncbi:MAG: glycosyl hydrolase-related protein [Bifidobacteriaceae bacterium]|jgi:alpha-mannosidase|nr:glycosyl hydrolase-related protein [Bifidobacteriaceae bacterium]
MTGPSADQIRLKARRLVEDVLTSAAVQARTPLRLTCWAAAGEPVGFDVARGQAYQPFDPDRRWGRPWGTTWFKAAGTVPADWPISQGPRPAYEAVVDLGFDPRRPGFGAEALAYRPDGSALKGVSSRNRHVPIAASPGTDFSFLLEAAANPDFALADGRGLATPEGRWRDYDGPGIYRLARADLVQLNWTVWDLVQDIEFVDALIDQLDSASGLFANAVWALRRMATVLDPSKPAETAAAARVALAGVTDLPASPGAHRVYAVGHAHLDTAWLWPVREARRKAARTFANALALLEEDPTWVFAASSAQHFAWIKQDHPDLWRRLRQAVATGTVAPVGGMWVEADANLPGGESLVRQFVFGKRFFKEEFGVEPKEAWLPDSFGYSAALPQIMMAAGTDRFVTQKLSWNDTNPFALSTFWWEGIDGTRVLAHMPPAGTYNAELTPAELARSESLTADKEALNASLLPFGYGDGGGGPTRAMLASARRAADQAGLPSVRLASPAQFFADAARSPDTAQLRDAAGSPEAAGSREASPSPEAVQLTDAARLPVWCGELYLEAHRGVFTTQAATKRGNSRTEALLHEAELWSATAAVRTGCAYPHQELEDIWRQALTGQFHDILPGSAIGWVHDEATRLHERLGQRLERLITAAIAALAGHPGSRHPELTFNPGPFEAGGVPGHSAGRPAPATPPRLTSSGDRFILANDRLRVEIDQLGHLVAVLDLATGRNGIVQGGSGNRLTLGADRPNRWDAWDLDLQDRDSIRVVDGVDWIKADDTAVALRKSLGRSQVVQRIGLARDSAVVEISSLIDWHEEHSILRMAFDLDVHSPQASYGIQFGQLTRPSHTNTSWDQARFEVPAQRWAHVGDSDFGLAVVRAGPAGYSVRRRKSADAARGAGFTELSTSLLRSPKFPDPVADQGEHRIDVALAVGPTSQAVRHGYLMARPVRSHRGAATTALVTSSDPGAIIDTVKLADDRSGDVVVRLYEAAGGRRQTRLGFGFAATACHETDLLERATSGSALVSTSPDGATVRLDPFQITTLRISPSGADPTKEQD